MRDSDFDAFADLLDAVCGLLSRGAYTPSPANTALFFRALRAHDIDTVRAGFDAHVKDGQRGRFVPVPADILAQIEGRSADDGRPGPEEAWATAIRGTDESATIVWTAETAEAWRIAKPVFDLGDEVGARMAFKEAYTRLVSESRALRIQALWSPSLGHDQSRRAAAIDDAVSAGLLSAPAVAGLLPPPDDVAMTAGPAVVESLQALKRALLSRPEAPSRDEESKRKTEDEKRVIARRVDEYQRGHL